MIRTHINDMREQDVIQLSSSQWAAAPVLVKKKPWDPNLRFCVDYRLLNLRTKKDSYPLPKSGTSLIDWERLDSTLR